MCLASRINNALVKIPKYGEGGTDYYNKGKANESTKNKVTLVIPKGKVLLPEGLYLVPAVLCKSLC